jgi:thiamine biosynthesis protein ThiI
MNRIVIHYSEIALKGKNRRHFVDALLQHVRGALGSMVLEVRKMQGRLVCKPADPVDPQQIINKLRCIPGIANFSLGHSAPKDIDAIGGRAVNLLADRDFTTFGVRTKRTDKAFPLKSDEISRKVGASIPWKARKLTCVPPISGCISKLPARRRRSLRIKSPALEVCRSVPAGEFWSLCQVESTVRWLPIC